MHHHRTYIGILAAAVLMVGCVPAQGGLAPQAGERVAEAQATVAAAVMPTRQQAAPALTTAAAAPAQAPAPAPVEPTPAQAPAPAAPADITGATLALVPVAQGVQAAVDIANAGDGSGRLFVVEKLGTIRIVRDGALLQQPFLDITALVESGGSEQGLLGMAFHPRYAENGRFFVAYTNRDGNQVVARYQASADAADSASAVTLLLMEDPAPNHNGGGLAFGPDGMLYIGTGDGGGGGDRYGNGQNNATLLGKLLRLDVDAGEPYAVPADNPHLGNPDVRPEIWATGLRNPWRFSFDRATGDLFIADVGQNEWEEVNWQSVGSRGGENYGWPITEATYCFREAGCDAAGLSLPVGEYGHAVGCSVTGGYVYRGQAVPALQGHYVYADYCSGRVWTLAPIDGSWRQTELADTELLITSFGEDEQGELYMVSLNDETLYRLALS